MKMLIRNDSDGVLIPIPQYPLWVLSLPPPPPLHSPHALLLRVESHALQLHRDSVPVRRASGRVRGSTASCNKRSSVIIGHRYYLNEKKGWGMEISEMKRALAEARGKGKLCTIHNIYIRILCGRGAKVSRARALTAPCPRRNTHHRRIQRTPNRNQCSRRRRHQPRKPHRCLYEKNRLYFW